MNAEPERASLAAAEPQSRCESYVLIRHPAGAPERGTVAGATTDKDDAVARAIALKAKEPESEVAVYVRIGRTVPNPVTHLFEADEQC